MEISRSLSTSTLTVEFIEQNSGVTVETVRYIKRESMKQADIYCEGRNLTQCESYSAKGIHCLACILQ